MSAWRVARFLMSSAVLVLFSWRVDAAELKISLRSHPKVEGAIPTEIELRAVRTDSDSKAPSKVAARFPGAVTIPLEVGSWALVPVSEGVWAHPLLIELEESGTEVDLQLWPAGPVSATLRVPRGESLPAGLGLRLRKSLDAPADVLPQPAEGETECLVKERGLLSCTAPTGYWSLRLKAPGYAARYFWGVKVASEEETNLGVVELLRGTSLMGRVVTEDGPADPRTTKVELRPAIDCGAASDERLEEISQLSLSTGINAWGFFQFYDVPPGHYVVVASQTGYAQASISPIPVVEDIDTVLKDPLRLRHPVRLALAIDPPQELYGGRWRVHMLRKAQSGRLDPVTEEEIQAGAWVSPPVPQGHYQVLILDSRDNYVSWSELEITEDLQPLVLQLDIVMVHGKVLLGEERISADLWFGRRSSGLSAETSTNDDGEFEVVLPRTGEWIVDVTSQKPRVQVRGISVDVQPPRGSQPVHVAIELSDTTVFGEVVNEAGLPVRGADVKVMGLEAPETKQARVISDGDGRFELRGQQPATYQLEAIASQGKSDVVAVQLIDGSAVGPVRLVLRRYRQLRGRVFSASGPVPQAFVMGYPITDGGGLATFSLPQTRTEMDGSFELDWPGDSSYGRVAILAPGYDFYLGRLSSDSTKPAVITLANEGGTLRLENLPVVGGPAAQPTVGLIVIDGEPIDAATVEMWAGMNGSGRVGEGTLVAPAMPSGSYSCCHLNPSEALLVVAGAAVPKASACTDGYLSPGGELTLAGPDG